MATAPCTHCGDNLDQWRISAPLPGVPIGRFIVPLVRKNAQVHDLQPGEIIPAHFLDIAGIAKALEALKGADDTPAGG